MSPRDKYKKLIDYANSENINGLSISDQNGVLHVTGTAPSVVKDRLWKMYGEIDPEMRGGDMVMNIQVNDNLKSKTTEETYEVKQGDNLSKIAKKYPNMTWNKIFEANKDTIKDPDKIFPGQKIRIPLSKAM